MNQLPPNTLTYDLKTIWLHWLTAGLVIALWCLGQAIDWFPRGIPRVCARSSHVTLGALLGFVLIYRIWWRATAGERLRPAGEGVFRLLAKSMHIALYACLLLAITLGLANTWVRGDNLFYLYTIPPLDSGNKALRATVETYHAYAANLLLALAGLHAIAGLVHQYIFKSDVLDRMLLPLRRR
jgi:cytochrome b561